MTDRPCYVYCLCDKNNCKVRYIGVSLDPKQRFTNHKSRANNKEYTYHNANWMRKCKDVGIRILFKGTEKECYALEVELIEKYKVKHDLTNTSSGGTRPPITHLFGKDNPKSVPVQQFDFDGNFIAEYDSCTEAAKAVNITRSCIGDCLSGRIKSSAGYIWKKK